MLQLKIYFMYVIELFICKFRIIIMVLIFPLYYIFLYSIFD